jgi:hypothetical protein
MIVGRKDARGQVSGAALAAGSVHQNHVAPNSQRQQLSRIEPNRITLVERPLLLELRVEGTKAAECRLRCARRRAQTTFPIKPQDVLNRYLACQKTRKVGQCPVPVTHMPPARSEELPTRYADGKKYRNNTRKPP